MENNEVTASVSTYDPADRLFGANPPTASLKKEETKSSLYKRLIIFLVGFLALVMFTVELAENYQDLDLHRNHLSVCKDGVLRSANTPESFNGDIDTWEKRGGKVTYSICATR
jgi:hypothetical protein